MLKIQKDSQSQQLLLLFVYQKNLDMNILLKRIARKPNYTIGRLYIDGKYFCDTIEDKDRGLK